MCEVEREREREREERWEEERGSIDSLIPAPLPVSAECQDLPPGKTNHKAEVMDVALQDPAVLPSGWPTLYISLMHSKLNLHLDGFPGPHPAQMYQKQPSTATPLMALIYHFQVYYVKMMLVPCSECQNDVTVTIKSHYMQPNGC